MDISTSVNKETLAALRAGYNTSEINSGDLVQKGLRVIKDHHRKALLKSHTEAFMDGLSLRYDAALYLSADSHKDYLEDKATYDSTANRLNEKYGRVAYLSDERKTGIIEEHYFPWAGTDATDSPAGE